MPAQASKERNGRYTRQTAISQSRRTANTNRSTSRFTGAGVYSEQRTNVSRSVYSSAEQRADIRPSSSAASVYTNTRSGSQYGAASAYNYQRTSPYSAPVYTPRTPDLGRGYQNGAGSRPRISTADETMRARGSAAAVSAQVRTASAPQAVREEAVRTAKRRILYCAVAAVIFLMCVFMIHRQTAIFSQNQEIDKLNAQYNDILVTNEGIQASINKSVELGNLESVAKNELGMISPDSSQIFYIDMENRDEVVKSGK